MGGNPSATQEPEAEENTEESAEETAAPEESGEEAAPSYAEALAAQEAAGKIYVALHTGRWDNQQVDGFPGSYSVYVPDNFEYCSPGVMLLVPGSLTASDWLDSEDGEAWREVADREAIALVAVEADGDAWNLSADSALRDDPAYLYGIYGKLTNKSDANESAFDLNERALYLVGYDDGAVAANEMAMKWPALFAGVAAVGGESVPAEVSALLGDAVSYPFAESTEAGSEENGIPNREIPVRVWEIGSEEDDLAETVSYWAAANGAEPVEIADPESLPADREGSPAQVFHSASSEGITPTVLYNGFLKNVQRFVGDPGGYLEWTVEHVNDGTHGFFLTEEKVDGYTRRWFTYVPASYDGSAEAPLVVAMHGYSSAITAFTGDSRWQNVADKYGFLVAFPQAYVNDGGYSGGSCIPVPIWNNYSPVYCNTTKDAPDDVAFIRHIVDKTKEDYAVDASRVYATGHSNGSAMTWMLAQDAPEYFTAVAPIGFNWGSYPGYELSGGEVDYSGCAENTFLLPVWCMTGEFDVGEAANYAPETKNGKTVSYWTAWNGANQEGTVTEEVRATRAEHTYTTTTFTGEHDAPLVRYTAISNNCHSYMEDIAFLVWEEFFQDFTRDTDGTLYYRGEAVTRTLD